MKLDVVIPFYNEEDCVRVFFTDLRAAFQREGVSVSRYIMVNDGSTDGTPSILDELARENPNVKAIHLWGNHGHQRALVAGLDYATGDAVLMMDGDGQHPAAVAARMARAFSMVGSPDQSSFSALRGLEG